MIWKIVKWLAIIVLIPLFMVGAVRLNHFLITWLVHDQIYKTVNEVPYRQYTLILGAGDYEPELWNNPAFNERMTAAKKLYFSGKTSAFILSGIKENAQYDEPTEMKEYLLAAGIPASSLVTDTLGLRTWISVQRLHDRFRIDRVIIISQPVHVERAVFSARCMGLDAIGFEAGYGQINTRFWNFRDKLSRVKAVLDCIAYHLKKY